MYLPSFFLLGPRANCRVKWLNVEWSTPYSVGSDVEKWKYVTESRTTITITQLLTNKYGNSSRSGDVFGNPVVGHGGHDTTGDNLHRTIIFCIIQLVFTLGEQPLHIITLNTIYTSRQAVFPLLCQKAHVIMFPFFNQMFNDVQCCML